MRTEDIVAHVRATSRSATHPAGSQDDKPLGGLWVVLVFVLCLFVAAGGA